MNKKIDLEEYVSSQSFVSRRELLNLLTQHKVYVNEQIVTDLSYPVSPDHDSIKVDGRYIENVHDYYYYFPYT